MSDADAAPPVLFETAPYVDQWHTVTVSYNRRDLILYSLGIGCGLEDPQFVYEHHPRFAAFPTYVTVLAFKGSAQEVVSFPSPAMCEAAVPPPLPGTRVGLDGEKHIELLAPLPPIGAVLTQRSRIIGVHKKGSGAVVESEMVFTDGWGTDLVRITSSAFYVGAHSFKDAGISRSKKVSIPQRAPDVVEEMVTAPSQALLYRLSGDYNPLHADPEFAGEAGFERPILHGLCSLGHSTRAVLHHFAGDDPARLQVVNVRFSSPVLPGQTLRVEMWDEGGGRVVFRTVNKETGKVAINNAYAQLAGPAQQQRAKL